MAKMKLEKNKDQVNPFLIKELGEEMAQMLNSAGRKLYAALVEDLKTSIGGTLNAHKAAVKDQIKEEFGNRGLVKANKALGPWVGQVVADAFQTVGEDIEEDLDSIADSMLDEPEELEEPEEPEERSMAQETEPEEFEDLEEEKSEAQEEEEELNPDEQITEAMASLSLLKKKGLKIASSIAKAGDPDTAAFLRMTLKKL